MERAMNPGWLRRRLGSLADRPLMRRSAVALAVTMLAGIAIGLPEILLSIGRARTEAVSAIEDVLRAVEPTAAGASWHLDERAAQRVVDGLLMGPFVQRAVVYADTGHRLAERWRPSVAAGIAERVGSMLFDGLERRDHTLFHAGREVPAGRLEIHVDTAALAQRWLDILLRNGLATAAQLLLLGLMLATAIHVMLTRPVRRIAEVLRKVDPDRPVLSCVPKPRHHHADEIGQMVDSMNELLMLLEQEQSALRRLATRDPLTGLPNRTLLVDRLGHAIAQSQRDGGALAVLFLDLDRFKAINDSLGHEVGDQVLKLVAERLKPILRASDTLARLGSHEFAVVVCDIDAGHYAGQIADRIASALGESCTVAGHAVRLAASVGIAVYPDDGQDAEELLRAAGIAMYAVKQSGTGSFQFFSPALNERAERCLRLEAELHRAIDGNELFLVYQPKIDPKTRRVEAAEALLRWRCGGEVRMPGEFIPLAEEGGAIDRIGRWVVAAACRQIAEWRRSGLSLPIAVNVSARQIRDPDFVCFVRDQLTLASVPGHLLEIELTETTVIADPEMTVPVLDALRGLGIRIAIDDFGTGYSSLAYLHRLPVDVVKIDMSFVRTLPDDGKIAAAILDLGQHFGLQTVAEGVEREDQLEWLVDNGCNLVQGWLFAPGLPAADFHRHCRDQAASVLENAG